MNWIKRGLSLWLASFCAVGAAQTTDGNPSFRARGDVAWGLNAGFSTNSPRLIGEVKRRRLAVLNAECELTIVANRSLALTYSAEAVPVMFLHQPREIYFLSKGADPYVQPEGWSYAAGVNPVGLRLKLRNGRRVQPYVDGHAGMLYFFDRQVPVPQSSQFNFAFSFGGGAQIRVSEKNWLSVGYRFHHLSNDNTGHFNPGVDSNLITVGWLHARRKR